MIKSLIWLLLLTTTFTTNVSENRINIRVEEAIPANSQYVMKIFSTHPIIDIEWFYDKDEIKCVTDTQGAICLISPKEDIKWNFLSIWYDKAAVEWPVMFDFSSSDPEVKPSPEIIASDVDGVFPNENERTYQGEESTSLYNVSVTLEEMNKFMNKKTEENKEIVKDEFPKSKDKEVVLDNKQPNNKDVIIKESNINLKSFYLAGFWILTIIILGALLLKRGK